MYWSAYQTATANTLWGVGGVTLYCTLNLKFRKGGGLKSPQPPSNDGSTLCP